MWSKCVLEKVLKISFRVVWKVKGVNLVFNNRAKISKMNAWEVSSVGSSDSLLKCKPVLNPRYFSNLEIRALFPSIYNPRLVSFYCSWLESWSFSAAELLHMFLANWNQMFLPQYFNRCKRKFPIIELSLIKMRARRSLFQFQLSFSSIWSNKNINEHVWQQHQLIKRFYGMCH